MISTLWGSGCWALSSKLWDAAYLNAGGVIEAGASSTVELRGDVRITGGILQGTGVFTVDAPSGSPAVLAGLTLDSIVRVPADSRLLLMGEIDNIGVAVEVSEGGGLGIEGDVMLKGGGTVTLSAHGGNAIFGAGLDSHLTNQDNRIWGSGRVGNDMSGALRITNRGRIEAGREIPLIVDPMDPPTSGPPVPGLINTGGGRLVADGGNLVLEDGQYDNAGGFIEAKGSSTVTLRDDAEVRGGTVVSTGGRIESAGYGSSPPLLADVTCDAVVSIDPGMALRIQDEIRFQDAADGLQLESSAAGQARLLVQGTTYLSGPGAVLLTGSQSSRILGLGGASHLVNQAVIRGHGQIGDASLGPLEITNAGMIECPANKQLWLAPTELCNVGEITVGEDAKIRFLSGSYYNYDPLREGNIRVSSGGTLELDEGVLLMGGQVTTEGTGAVKSIDAGIDRPRLRNTSISGTVLFDGGFEIGFQQTVATLTGVVFRFEDTQSRLYMDGDVTLDGDKMTLAAGAAGLPVIRGAGRLTIKNELSGFGVLGTSGGHLSITVQGSLAADTAQQLLIRADPAPADLQPGLLVDAGGALKSLKTGGILVECRNFEARGEVLAADGSIDFEIIDRFCVAGGGAVRATDTGIVNLTASSTPDVTIEGTVEGVKGGRVHSQVPSLKLASGGVLKAAGAGRVVVQGSQFLNQGTVEAATGGIVDLTQTVVGNIEDAGNGLARLAGGTWSVSGLTEQGQLLFPAGNPIAFNQATIILHGPQFTFPAITRLKQNGPQGTFRIANACEFETYLNFENFGQLEVQFGGHLLVPGNLMQSNGSLRVDGRVTTQGSFTNHGGAVSGSGTINGKPVENYGCIAPGDSVGTLHFEGLHLMNGSVLEMEIEGPNADLIHVFGTATDSLLFEENATYQIDLAVLDDGGGRYREFPLIAWDGVLSPDRGVFDTVTWDFGRSADELAGTPVVEFRMNDGGIGGMLVMTNVVFVPEPSGFVLAIVGVLGLALIIRNRTFMIQPSVSDGGPRPVFERSRGRRPASLDASTQIRRPPA